MMGLHRQQRVTLAVLGLTALLALAMLVWQRRRLALSIETPSSAFPSTSGASVGRAEVPASWDGSLAFARAVDLNTADVSELERLPGIGVKLAERIVAFRQQAGPFQDLRALERIEGIGPKTIEAIEEYVRFPISSTREKLSSPKR
jgi:competence protein ComEA